MRNIYNFLINKRFNISNEFIKRNKAEKINLIDNFLVKPKSEYIQINNDDFDKLRNNLIDDNKVKIICKDNTKVNAINNNNEYLNKKRKYKFHDNKLSSDDHIIKKIRIMILNAIFKFVNEKIKTLFNDNIGKSICTKQFISISRTYYLSHSNVEFDKIFIHTKLKEILSWKISRKYTVYLDNHNKMLVQYLINEEKNGKYFQELFELSFLDCLDHICDKRNNELFNGLDKIDEIITNEGNLLNEDEKEIYKYYIIHYETAVNNKKRRRKLKLH